MKKIQGKSNKRILPSGFAQSVITHEFEIEKGGIELTDLISLYQSAVEYYDSIGDLKNSEIYKQKMMMVFMKPHISKMFMPEAKKKSPKHKKRSKSPPKQKAAKASPPQKRVSPPKKKASPPQMVEVTP